MLISQKRWELTQRCVIRYLYSLIFDIEWRHFECCTAWPLPTFSRFWKINISETASAGAKRRYDVYRFWYFKSNSVTVNIVLRDLDLNLQGHKSETLISRKQWELSQKAWCDVYRPSCLLSNGTVANIVFRSIDLNFRGKKNWNVLVSFGNGES